MTFDEYQQSTRETAKFPTDHMPPAVYCALGMAGECGETIEKIKKVYRDKGGVFDDETRRSIALELGDVTYYLASIAFELGIPLSEVIRLNREKTTRRKRENRIHGSGDDR